MSTSHRQTPIFGAPPPNEEERPLEMKKPPPVMKNGVERSPLWKYFSQYVNAKEKGFARCHLCYDEMMKQQGEDFIPSRNVEENMWDIRYEGSTTKLDRHIRRKHRDIYMSMANTKAEERQRVQCTMDGFIIHGGSFMKDYLRWIVSTYKPLNTCEEPTFVNMISHGGRSTNLHSLILAHWQDDICAYQPRPVLPNAYFLLQGLLSPKLETGCETTMPQLLYF